MRVEPFSRDDLDGFDDAGDDFVFEADVLAFGIFADDDEVDAGPVGLRGREDS